jgi:DNA-binding NarL/FixJ family response regulator
MTGNPLRVLVVDDHPLVRFALRELLVREIPQVHVGEAGNSADALLCLRAHPWNIMVLDLDLGGDDGFEVLRAARQGWPDVPVLMLSVHPPPRYSRRAIDAGAAGYLHKARGLDDLVATVERICANQAPVAAAVPEWATPKAPHEQLSLRELQVLRQLAAGRRMSEIAVTLGLSVKTVSTYRQRMLEKLRMRNNAAAIRYAVEQRLVDH